MVVLGYLFVACETIQATKWSEPTSSPLRSLWPWSGTLKEGNCEVEQPCNQSGASGSCNTYTTCCSSFWSKSTNNCKCVQTEAWSMERPSQQSRTSLGRNHLWNHGLTGFMMVLTLNVYNYNITDHNIDQDLQVGFLYHPKQIPFAVFSRFLVTKLLWYLFTCQSTSCSGFGQWDGCSNAPLPHWYQQQNGPFPPASLHLPLRNVHEQRRKFKCTHNPAIGESADIFFTWLWNISYSLQ